MAARKNSPITSSQSLRRPCSPDRTISDGICNRKPARQTRLSKIESGNSLVVLGASGARQLGLGLIDHAFGFGVLLFAVAGLVPQLLAVIELLPCALDVNLRRSQGVICQNGHPIRQHFHKSPA